MNTKKDYVDLTAALPVDTYLTVKFGMKWVHYNIPCIKKDGTQRTFGELYHFYTKKKDFKMALGYIRREDETAKYWTAQTQYFYFSKVDMPYLVSRRLEKKLLLKK